MTLASLPLAWNLSRYSGIFDIGTKVKQAHCATLLYYTLHATKGTPSPAQYFLFLAYCKSPVYVGQPNVELIMLLPLCFW